jgi:hypothetical protein
MKPTLSDVAVERAGDRRSCASATARRSRRGSGVPSTFAIAAEVVGVDRVDRREREAAVAATMLVTP